MVALVSKVVMVQNEMKMDSKMLENYSPCGLNSSRNIMFLRSKFPIIGQLQSNEN